MQAIPVPIRQRIITLYDQGKSTRQIADSLGYSIAAVRRVRQYFKERKTLVPQTDRCGRTGYFTQERQAKLKEMLAAKPDSTLQELAQAMDIPVHFTTIHLWLKKLNVTFKKSPSTPQSRIDPTSRSAGKAGTRISLASTRKG